MKRQAPNCPLGGGKDKLGPKNRRKSNSQGPAGPNERNTLDQKLKELDKEHLKTEGQMLGGGGGSPDHQGTSNNLSLRSPGTPVSTNNNTNNNVNQAATPSPSGQNNNVINSGPQSNTTARLKVCFRKAENCSFLNFVFFWSKLILNITKKHQVSACRAQIFKRTLHQELVQLQDQVVIFQMEIFLMVLRQTC